jgi:beta-phosphoglucomutase-like phosphatase (HAD superfamily)
MVTNADSLHMTFQAVLFDCDGVLVDSEASTCGALRDMLDENGWRLSLAECRCSCT